MEQIIFIADRMLGAAKRLTEAPYLLSTLAFVLAAWAYEIKKGTATFNFVKYCFPKQVFLHPSARFDYKYFLFDRVFITGMHALGLVLLGLAVNKAVPFYEGISDNNFLITIFYTAVLAIAYDFGKFIAHYLEHFVPFLWQFHRLHHSAGVLTPITNYRAHPVDRIMAALCTLAMRFVVTGVFLLIFPGELTVVEILGSNALQLFINMLGSSLGHSHVWISYGRVLNHIFISPAQHQIHHSSEERHLDKNMGLKLAVWDWMFGTLYVPKEREQFKLGLKGENWEVPTSVFDAYVGPFKRLKDPVNRALTRRGAEEKSAPADTETEREAA
ncbi:sterol desaturase family protein [Kordiimonas pumila]|uniref:Sterol desaturase family protein n=1 Tax=Kordiimonas pumila TaxID=2161677 RepID=A0ABV7D0K5_9PROT|nr:sterol desaturase family protein [Kordiimonas pumila]